MGRARSKKRRRSGDVPAEFGEDERFRADPRCPHAADCGGCTWQSLTPQVQLEIKRRGIVAAFDAAGLEIDVPVPLAAPSAYRYRNRMEFTFSARRWLTRAEIASGETFERNHALGLHAPGGFDRVLDIGGCAIQSEAADRILHLTREFSSGSKLPPWNKRTHRGFWRYLGIRVARATGQVLVHVVTSELRSAVIADLAALLVEQGGATTVVNGVTDRIADTSEGAILHVVHGPGFIEEKVGSIVFRLGATTFFQPNTGAAEILFDLVAEMADAGDDTRVLDLFCGTGALSLWLDPRSGEVTGYELSPESVASARDNAARNGIGRCRFEVVDLLSGLPPGTPTPDVVIVDPPRAGMHPRVLRDLASLGAARIVSVGCNPRTQARDVAGLVNAGGYRVARTRSVDQFPQTPHVENVVLLVKD